MNEANINTILMIQKHELVAAAYICPQRSHTQISDLGYIFSQNREMTALSKSDLNGAIMSQVADNEIKCNGNAVLISRQQHSKTQMCFIIIH